MPLPRHVTRTTVAIFHRDSGSYETLIVLGGIPVWFLRVPWALGPMPGAHELGLETAYEGP